MAWLGGWGVFVYPRVLLKVARDQTGAVLCEPTTEITHPNINLALAKAEVVHYKWATYQSGITCFTILH